MGRSEQLLDEALAKVIAGMRATLAAEWDFAEASLLAGLNLLQRIEVAASLPIKVLVWRYVGCGVLADLAGDRGQFDEEQRYRDAKVALDQRIRQLTGDTHGALHDVIKDLTELGYFAKERDDLDEAQRCFEARLALTGQLRQLTGDAHWALSSENSTRVLLGDLASARGQLDEAKRHYEAHLALTEQIRQLTGDTPRGLHDVEMAQWRLATLASALGQFDEAKRHYEAKLALAEQIRQQTGDTPDVLRDVRSSRIDLGNVALTRGQFDEAQQHFEAQLALDEQIGRLTGDTALALTYMCGGLDRLGYLALIRGRRDEAQQRYEAILALAEQIRQLTGDTPNALQVVSAGLEGLGLVAVDLTKKQRHYEAQLALAEQIRRLTGDTYQALRNVCVGLKHLGDLARIHGRLDEARQRYEAMLALAEQIRQLTGDTPEALDRVSQCLDGLGLLDKTLGDLDEAQRHCEACLALSEQIRQQTGNTPAALGHLGIIRGRLGDLARHRDQGDKARRHYEAQLALAEQMRQLTGDTHLALNLLCAGLERLGDLALSDGRFDEAQQRYGAELALTEHMRQLTGDTPAALSAMSFSLGRLSTVAELRGDSASAKAQSLKSSELAVLATRFGGELLLSHLYLETSRLVRQTRKGIVPNPQAWPYFRSMSRRVIEYADLNHAEWIERARPRMDSFFGDWLSLALERAADCLPEVLGSVQGRKVSLLLQDTLQRESHSPQAVLVPEFKDFQAARQRLLMLAVQLGTPLQAQSFGEAQGNDIFDTVVRTGVERQLLQPLRDQYNCARLDYDEARDALLAIRPDLADIKPADADRYSVETLQQGLAEGAALLLLIDAPAGEHRLYRSHALLIPKHGSVTLKGLPELDALPSQLHAYRGSMNRGGRSCAYRDCQGWTRAMADEAANAPVTPIDAAVALQERLWSAFEAELQPKFVKHLHVVSHGNLHNLPLPLGAPDGISILQYPGLVYYWIVHNRDAGAPIMVDNERPLSAEVCAADEPAGEGLFQGLMPIPHVLTEDGLLATCWGKVDRLLNQRQHGDDRPATITHIACHGTLKREGQEDPCLILGTDKAFNLIELLNGEKSSPVVYLSACLVGQTKEDVDGDPLGLVGAFMIRGAKVVIAALNPIDDFWAPLLAYLFHRTLQAQNKYETQLAPVEALEDAKRQVEIGEWVPCCVPDADRKQWQEDSESAVVQAYAPQVQKQLEQVLTLEGCEDLATDWGLLDKICLVDQADWVNSILSYLAKTGLGTLLPETRKFVRAVLMTELLAKRGQATDETVFDNSAGTQLMKQVVLAKAQLYEKTEAVRLLLQDMQAFGAVPTCETAIPAKEPR